MIILVVRIDIHSVVTPSGATIPEPEFVAAEVKATQSLVRVEARPILRKGDKFRCEHVPKAGVFKNPLPAGTGEGCLANPGQDLLKIDGVFAATMAGTNTSCSEAVEEMQNQATVMLDGSPLLFVEGRPVLTGR